MEYKYKQEEEGNGEYIAFESSLKEYFKIQPIFAHIKLGKIYRSHPNQIEYGKKQMILRKVNGIGPEYGHAGK